jgi:hypothetical protein
MAEQFCVIDPITIAGTVLVSTNVPETDYSEYASGTTYAVDTVVQVAADHVVYKSLQNANTGHTPSTSPTWWSVVGPTNARAMFDGKVNTQTANADSIVVVIKPSSVSRGVGVLNVEGDSATVTMTDPTDGVVYTNTVTSEKHNSGSSFYNWFFKRIRRRTQFYWTDLPPYYNATITITKPGGTAKCGMCIVGPVEQCGYTKFGLSPGIKDYSTSLFDQFGNLTTVERSWGKKLTVNLQVDNSLIDDLQLQFAGWRAKPLLFIASSQYESTGLYARYDDFKVVIDNPVKSDIALSLNGLI